MDIENYDNKTVTNYVITIYTTNYMGRNQPECVRHIHYLLEKKYTIANATKRYLVQIRINILYFSMITVA